MAQIIDTRKTPVAVNDAARPFAVLFGGRVVGRYETERQAKRKAAYIDDETPPRADDGFEW